MAAPEEINPYRHDPDRWGTSMAQMVSLMVPSLDAVGAKRVFEIGAYGGDLTAVLAAWAADAGAKVTAIDPAPQPALVKLAEGDPNVDLVRAKSTDVLGRMECPDVIVLDGDHNYFTVLSELRLIAEAAGDGGFFPLVFMHDVCWPHGRRDDYFDASQIPADLVHETIGDTGGIAPGETGIKKGAGLPYARSASREGGPRNGVLTAAEDFVAEMPQMRLAVIPAFFGLGAIWRTDASWAPAVEEILQPFDRSLLMERLEGNRVIQLERSHSRLVEIWELRERLARQEALLERLLQSNAMSIAERLSRLRVRAGVATEHAPVTKEQIRQARGS